jgi:class 3 adenylate cyclase
LPIFLIEKGALAHGTQMRVSCRPRAAEIQQPANVTGDCRAVSATTDHSIELERLRDCARLNREADAVLERAQRLRLPLARTLDDLLPVLQRSCGAVSVWLRTADEDLQETDFGVPATGNTLLDEAATLVDATASGSPLRRALRPGTEALAQTLDVDGEAIGWAAVEVCAGLPTHEVQRLQALLDTWCEELDGHLSAIARARAKHRITMAIGRALKHPVLDQGISDAVHALGREVPFDDLILVYCGEGEFAPGSLHYRVVRSGRLELCSLRGGGARADGVMLDRLHGVLQGDREAMEALGLTRYREDALVSGVLEEQIIGRLVVGRAGTSFNIFERDLLERFADYLRHRIVDFNREWRTLARSFAQPVVAQLLGEESYRKHHLSPREEEVAVLYGDISGFTRLSEQVLREPALIGRFVDAWSRGVVEILWRHEGVFDKMVGDCIIGLWGPPFFRIAAEDACSRAIAAATEIRAFTAELAAAQPTLAGFAEPVGVAIGVNYCPLLVGFFGPNDNYTGFSSGMNNTARLQGLAGQDEILCMESVVTALGASQRFGALRSAQVKNVAEPLRYRRLR